MAKVNGKFVNLDATSMQNDGGAVAVLPDPAGGLERGGSGLKIAVGGVTDAMLANADIARVDEAETISGVWTFGTLPQSSSNPTSDNEFARKAYVDSVAYGFDPKASVRVATTANIALLGAPTIDGVGISAGDRVLVKNQTTASENGIYVAAVGAWSRSADANSNAEVTSGMMVWVSEGTSNGGSQWALSTADPITLGTTSLTFVQTNGGSTIVGGAGLTLTGNTLAVVAADASITVNADSIQVHVDGVTIEVDATNGLQLKAGGIQTAHIGDGEVTRAKMEDVVSSALLGRGDSSSGAPQEITLGTGLEMDGTTLNVTVSGGSSRVVERFTLDATAMTNKYVTLASTPASAGRTLLTVKGAGNQHYGDDYQMDGGNPNRLTWNGLGLDGTLASGDKFTVEYDT